MKQNLAKICALIPFVIYGVLLLTYFAFTLESFRFTYIFVFGLLFGWILVLVSGILGIVFSRLSQNAHRKGFCFYSSVVNAVIAVIWAVKIFMPFLSFASPPKPKPVYNLTWHILDDSIRNEKITLNLSTWDKEKTKTRTLKAGKTKKIRLPEGDFENVEGIAEDNDTLVFVPYGFEINWDSEADRYVKADSYEIILYKKPAITEDEEAFRMESVPHDTTFELCYWDKDLRKFVHIESSDGVFYKKDKSEELLLNSKKDYPDSDEQFNLFMSVQSSVYADKKYNLTLTYDRDKRFLPVKNIRTYIQDGREIKTENVELNGTNWVKTQYINKSTGEPIANKAAQIYLLGDEIDGIIYAQTDENGWLSVKNLPDGAECYVDFVD
ncbi:MAG: hypothetical protein K6B43_14080 [Treponema sp.]|nr:hypothetical protein [Treponema sp.]